MAVADMEMRRLVVPKYVGSTPISHLVSGYRQVHHELNCR